MDKDTPNNAKRERKRVKSEEASFVPMAHGTWHMARCGWSVFVRYAKHPLIFRDRREPMMMMMFFILSFFQLSHIIFINLSLISTNLQYIILLIILLWQLNQHNSINTQKTKKSNVSSQNLTYFVFIIQP